MMFPSLSLRAVLMACATVTLPLSSLSAAEPICIVFQNGRAVPLAAVALQADKLVITAAADGFTVGQAFPLQAADHVFGEKPATLNPAIALVLMDKPQDALKLLEPIISEQRLTAKIPGNFWMEAARAALVAYAVAGDAAKCSEIGKEISEASSNQGSDPFVSLGKALQLPVATKADERGVALGDLTTDNLPADVCAYASFYRANLLSGLKRDAIPARALEQDVAALEAYLTVPCLFPSGGMILNGIAELKAAEFLVNLGRQEEAVALLKSSIRNGSGTLVAVAAEKRLVILK